VLHPGINPGIVQAHDSAGNKSGDIGSLGPIAVGAAVTEVVFLRRAPMLSGDDMIHMEAEVQVAFMQQAILAAS
jgi:hypothetical protein